MAPPPDSDRSGHTLFVYGTLRREGLAQSLLGGSEYLGETTISGILYDLGSYPALELNGGAPVHGEIWRCSAETLERLDSYEGVPEGLFSRVRVVSTRGTAWTYVAGPALRSAIADAPAIASGRWMV